jgi:selenide,water dikinase
MNIPKLTQFSPGAGCGCKIAPAQLKEILSLSAEIDYSDDKLLVGNSKSDDAAVYLMDDDNCVISTTDFFTPIVDDPYNFGRIAATNAISDIYAMGGTPIMAIAILGWPLDKLDVTIAGTVLKGARQVCKDNNMVLAGGHSIDIADPIFGLAVTGTAKRENIKQNSEAVENCSLFLTKPLGIGMLTTAEKKSVLLDEDQNTAVDLMLQTNKIGAVLGKESYVKTMTDVTGFGLLGHLIEICEGSNISAEIDFNEVPVISNIDHYLSKKSFPGGTFRNWKSYGHKSNGVSGDIMHILCDPQTSGGLLIAVEQGFEDQFIQLMQNESQQVKKIGETIKKTGDYFVYVK